MSDLVLCEREGVAHYCAKDRARYDGAYFAKVSAYEDTDVARRVNDARCAMLMRHLNDDGAATVLDIGAGTGAFIRAARAWGFDALGYDVMEAANDRLRADGVYSEPSRGFNFEAVTLWDVIEHLEQPQTLLAGLMRGTYVFVSTPIFRDFSALAESKHYRPGEHLHYWTEAGLLLFFERLRYKVLEVSDHEVQAGREDIGAFAFIKE